MSTSTYLTFYILPLISILRQLFIRLHPSLCLPSDVPPLSIRGGLTPCYNTVDSHMRHISITTHTKCYGPIIFGLVVTLPSVTEGYALYGIRLYPCAPGCPCLHRLHPKILSTQRRIQFSPNETCCPLPIRGCPATIGLSSIMVIVGHLEATLYNRTYHCDAYRWITTSIITRSGLVFLPALPAALHVACYPSHPYCSPKISLLPNSPPPQQPPYSVCLYPNAQ